VVGRCPPGRLITYCGKPIAEIDTTFLKARDRAKLPGREAPYSIRHMIGRHMRRCGVDIMEIATWLGHVQPPQGPETTLLYSPHEPDYLSNAKAAVEDFVKRLDSLTHRNLLKPPWLN
jgi:hypothetical protein